MIKDKSMVEVLMNTHQGVALLVDKKGTILAMNETMANTRFGKAAKELIGRCIYDLDPPDAAQKRKALAEKVYREGKPINYEDTFI